MSVSRWLLASPILCKLSLTMAGSSTLRCAMVVSPRIAFMGVRMSWDMAERKSLLARFAASASFAASFRRALNQFMKAMSQMSRNSRAQATPPTKNQSTVLRCKLLAWM